jgi:hypothetical protein
MEHISEQAEFFELIFQSLAQPFRLRANDIILLDGKLCRVIRVTECAAVVVMNRRVREFSTRFDKRVRFQPSPVTFRISPNAEIEIVNGHSREREKHKQNERRIR